MCNYYKSIIIELENHLNFISIEIDDPIELSEQAVNYILKTIEKLRKQLLKKEFKSQEEEINFFKNIKPRILSKLIYYNTVYKIETRKPHGGEKEVKKYLNNELGRLKRFFDNNLDFYRYYRTNSTYLDFKYFVRGKHDIKLSLDTFYFEADHRFTTSHDFIVAKIIAHDLIQVYLENELTNLDKKLAKEKSQHEPNKKLTWTGSKVSLIEIIYAFQSEGVFNNGTADIKDIVEHFEENFNINLGQYRRTFLEIRARKTDRPKFIQSLKDTLEKRMDNFDETI